MDKNVLRQRMEALYSNWINRANKEDRTKKKDNVSKTKAAIYRACAYDLSILIDEVDG